MKFLVSAILAVGLLMGGGPVVAAQEQASAHAASADLINLNTASAEDLQDLPGIGAVKAERIVAQRTAKPFATVDELTAVEGIGQATLEKIRHRITVD